MKFSPGASQRVASGKAAAIAGPKYQCSGLVLGSTMCETRPPMRCSAASSSAVGATGLCSCGVHSHA